MVGDLHIASSASAVGMFVGLLSSSFFVAQLFSSYFWCRLSDQIGRKPVILIGLLGSAASILVFGSSATYAQAVLGRAGCGLLNGNVGVLKAMLSDITDASNRGVGFSLIQLSSGLGGIVGPVVGGLLCRPAIKYPHALPASWGGWGVFEQFPYLLPCFLGACSQLLAALLCVVFLRESRPSSPSSSPPTGGGGGGVATFPASPSISSPALPFLSSPFAASPSIASPTSASPSAAPASPLLMLAGDEMSGGENYQPLAAAAAATEAGTGVGEEEEDSDAEEARQLRRSPPALPSPRLAPQSRPWEEQQEQLLASCGAELLSDIEDSEGLPYVPFPSSPLSADGKSIRAPKGRNTPFSGAHSGDGGGNPVLKVQPLLAVALYGVIGLVYIMFDELLPLFCATRPHYGGLGLNSSRIGVLVMASGFALAAFTLLLLPAILRRFSPRNIFRHSLLLNVPLLVALPLTAWLLPPRFPAPVLWAALLPLLTLKMVLSCCQFTTVMVLISTAVPPAHVGAVSGLAQSVVALTRALGPSLGGTLWSLSLSLYHTTSLATSFVYWGVAVLCILAALAARWVRQAPGTAAAE